MACSSAPWRGVEREGVFNDNVCSLRRHAKVLDRVGSKMVGGLVHGSGKGFVWLHVKSGRSCQAMTSIMGMIAAVFLGKCFIDDASTDS